MPESKRLIPLIRRLAAGAIASMIVLALTVAVSTSLAWNSTRWVIHTRAVQFAGADALSLATDLQTSVATYLITGDSSVLATERAAKPELSLMLDSLARLTADNPVQQLLLTHIDSEIREWERAFVDPVVRASDSEARARLARQRQAGALEFSRVRERFQEFLDREAALFVTRSRSTTLWRWGQVVLVATESVFLLFVLVRMRRELLLHAAGVLEQEELLSNQAKTLEEQAVEQETITADLELANRELVEASEQAEAAHAATALLEDQYRLLFDRNPVPMWVYDEETLSFLAVNASAVEQYGFSAAEFLTMKLEDIRTPEDAELLRNSKGIPDQLHRSPGWRHRRKDGSLIEVDIVTHSVTFEGRRARIVLALDVTARVTAELALNESDAILRAVIDDSPLPIVILSPELKIIRWNGAAEKQFCWSAKDALGQSLYSIIPDNKRNELAALRARLEAGETIANYPTQRRRLDGTVRDMLVSQGVLRDSNGVLTGFVGIYSDVTDSNRLETQFRQAQKMEAVGQLAGGVAHDFNNLLTVIISYSQMLLTELAEDSTELADVREIKRAAERAALLTKQLLAFSRQQVLKPHVLDLNLVIGDLEQMLRRLLREDIEIDLKLDPNLGATAADPGQIEQIVMNLVVNARDAMPNGGRLSIETSNVEFDTAYQLRVNEAPIEPGSYVMIAVSDNGIGMSREVQAHVFEPFFTTKPVHQGTGLGLSTVYGIVKQSGGHLAMYSEPAHGTIFKIYLPRVDAVAESTAHEEALQDSSAKGGGETVLIVEDDAALRIVACRALQERGYVVLEAENGSVALQVCTKHRGDIDLVVTDMVMPEMSGAELAERIAERFPGIRVLLMSGYTRDEAARRGIASERYSFLEKPFTPMRLAARVREVLDRKRISGSMLQQQA